MSKWFYSIDGQVHGPVEQEEIESLLKSKKIAFEDRIYRDGDAKWKPVFEQDEFKKIFEELKIKSDVQWVVLFKKPKEKGKGFVQKGPFTTEEVKAKIQNGEIEYGNYVWKEGMEKWLKVSDLSEFNPSVVRAPEAVKANSSKVDPANVPPALPDITMTAVKVDLKDIELLRRKKTSVAHEILEHTKAKDPDIKKAQESLDDALDFDDLTETVFDSNSFDVDDDPVDQFSITVTKTKKGSADLIVDREDVEPPELEVKKVIDVKNEKTKKEVEPEKPPTLDLANTRVNKRIGVSKGEEDTASERIVGDIKVQGSMDVTEIDKNIPTKTQNLKKEKDKKSKKKEVYSKTDVKTEKKQDQAKDASLESTKDLSQTDLVQDDLKPVDNNTKTIRLNDRGTKPKKKRSSRKKSKNKSHSKAPQLKDVVAFFSQPHVLQKVIIVFLFCCLLGIIAFVGLDKIKHKIMTLPIFTSSEVDIDEDVEDGSQRMQNKERRVAPPKSNFQQPAVQNQRPSQLPNQASIRKPLPREVKRPAPVVNKPVITQKPVQAVSPPAKPAKPKKEPTYFRIDLQKWNTPKAEIVVQTDGTDDYTFRMDVTGQFGKIIGRKNFYARRFFKRDRSILVSKLNLDAGEYKITFKYKDVQAAKVVFWGSKNKQFNIDVWKLKKRSVFEHHNERAQLINITSRMRSVLSQLVNLNRTEANSGRWWKSYGVLIKQWRTVGRQQFNGIKYSKASRYVHYFTWEHLKEIKSEVQSAFAIVSKSSNRANHPENAKLQQLLREVSRHEQRSKTLSIW